MNKVAYLLSEGLSARKRLREMAVKASRESGKKVLFTECDMLLCAILYGAGYTDYYVFGMYDMNPRQRRTVLTRGKNNDLVRRFNPKEAWHLFDNKHEFNRAFHEYLKRKWIYLPDCSEDELTRFLEGPYSVIAKPDSDSGGHGIELVRRADHKSPGEMKQALMSRGLTLLEEVIRQHEVLRELYPHAVNTLRLITMKWQGEIHFLTAFLRIGNHGAFVDNTSSGGMLTMIDLETGVTLYPACDNDRRVYKEHPETKKAIAGMEIPHFKEAKEMVRELALKTEDLGYIAWDIAIAEEGPVLVEGNPYPGYYYQYPIHTKNKTGAYSKVEAILGEAKRK